MNDSTLTKKDKLLAVMLSVISGILFDYFFYGKIPGISYPLYLLLMLCLFSWNTRKILKVQRSFEWLLIVSIILLSSTFALFSNPILRAVNFLLIPLLLVSYTILAVHKESTWWRLEFIGDILKRVTIITMQNVHKPFIFTLEQIAPKEKDSFRESGKKIFIGILISIPILMVIIPLLSSADLVFNHYLSNITKLSELINFRKPFSHGFLILFVSVYIFSYMWSFKTDHPPSPAPKYPTVLWDPTIALTVLIIINSVYLIFSVIQVSYLYGAGSQLLPQGFTYAQYARRGFFELVAVTIFNLAIILLNIKFVKKDYKKPYKLAKIALSLLVIFSLNLLFSANFKMFLYEEAYGLTYLRVFVHYFMGLLLVLLLLTLGRIWRSGFPLIKSYIIFSLIFYTTINFINVDTIIAKRNFQMFQKSGSIDVYYLQGLSYDAVPELVRLANNENPEISRQAHEYLQFKKAELSPPTPWQSFNYSQYKARTALKKYFEHTKRSGTT